MNVRYTCHMCGRPAKPAFFRKLNESINVPICIFCVIEKRWEREVEHK